MCATLFCVLAVKNTMNQQRLVLVSVLRARAPGVLHFTAQCLYFLSNNDTPYINIITHIRVSSIKTLMHFIFLYLVNLFHHQSHHFFNSLLTQRTEKLK